MPSSNVCWGLEVGASSIKALKLELEGEDKVKVLDYAIVQHPKPLSTPGVDPNDVLRVSLGQLVSQVDFTGAQVAVSVPGHSAFARFAKLPPVEPKKVPDIVRFEAMQQIPFPLEQVEWDYQTFVSPDSPDVEVGIFAITRERVNERLTMLRDVGIEPSFVVLSPIAVYNALAYDLGFDDKTAGTIIVDVGTTSTDLVIATPGRMWVRTFPIGGHQFTEALVSQFQLSYPKAEKLKREAEDTKHARQVFQAMRPVFTDLAQEVQRSIGYYQSINKDANLTRLIGVGSTFELPGLRKFLKTQLSLDVYRIEQFKKATLTGERAQAYDAASLSLCTCYGLALQGLGLNAVGGNLMPVAVLREGMWRSKTKWFAMAAGVAVAGSAAMFIRPFMDSMAVTGSSPDPIIATALRQANEAKSRAEQAGVTSAGEPNLDASNMVSLLERRDVFLHVMNDVKTMLGSADRAAADRRLPEGVTVPPGPAFSLVRMETTYRPPAAPAAEDPFGGQTGGASGRGEQVAVLGAGGQREREQPEPEGIAEFPRFKVDLDLTTFQPETGRFVRDTLGKWLRDNLKVRDGVPYVIVVNEVPFSVSGASAAAAPATPSAGDARPGGRMASGSIDLGGGMELTIQQQRELEEQERRARAALGRSTGGEGPSAGAGTGGANVKAQAAVALDALAPIGTPAEERDLQRLASTVRLTFYVVFKPPAPAEGAEGAGGGT